MCVRRLVMDGVERSACRLRLCRASTGLRAAPRAPPRRRYRAMQPEAIQPEAIQPDQADALVLALRRAARDLVSRRSINDLEQALTQIVAVAVDTVPGVDAGGISMTENGHITSRSPTNDEVHKLDDLQAQLHEGPCISAVEYPPEDGVVLAQDLTQPPDAERWPRFAPQAVAHGYQSLLSTHLSADGGTRAALNLYSHAANTF